MSRCFRCLDRSRTDEELAYAQVAMSFAPFSASVMSTIVNLYIGLPVVVTTGRL